MDTTCSAPEADTEKGQEASNSRQDPGVYPTAYTRGAWKGSDVKPPEIDWLYRSPGCRRRCPAGFQETSWSRSCLSRRKPPGRGARDSAASGSWPGIPGQLGLPGTQEQGSGASGRPQRSSPAKRSKKNGGGKPFSRKRYRSQMPIASGPALSLTRSAPGMRLEASEDATRTSTPPQPNPVPSGTDKSPASPLGGNTSAGRAAPETFHHRAEEDFFSPPDTEDTGASNIGTGNEDAERAEPPVPPTPKKKKAATSPAKTVPETSAPASPSPAKEAPEAPATTKDAPTSSPAASTGKPAHPGGANLTAQQLAAVVTTTTAPPSGSQALTLHAAALPLRPVRRLQLS
nr:uncharacterized protein LOC127303759 [Lolium perenne]